MTGEGALRQCKACLRSQVSEAFALERAKESEALAREPQVVA